LLARALASARPARARQLALAVRVKLAALGAGPGDDVYAEVEDLLARLPKR
jgi:hypothetical protein